MLQITVYYVSMNRRLAQVHGTTSSRNSRVSGPSFRLRSLNPIRSAYLIKRVLGLATIVRRRTLLLFIAIILVPCSTSAIADDIDAAARGVVRIIVATQDYSDPNNSSVGFGTGFAISPHRIVTNAHLVKAARNPYANSVVAIVPSEGGRARRGTIMAYDQARDLAVIDVTSLRLEPLGIFSGQVDSGQVAAALGYPGNVDRATVNSLDDIITPTAPVRAEGNISGQRNIEGTPALLHTAAISRGNSGGPLVDACGRVLGVNTYTAVTNSGDAPFGFAIVSQELLSFLRENNVNVRSISGPCITMAEQARREEQARELAQGELAIAKRRDAEVRQERLAQKRSRIQEIRDNHAAGASLLAIISVIAGTFGTALFFKDRGKAAGGAATVSALALAASAYSFFSRPSFEMSISHSDYGCHAPSDAHVRQAPVPPHPGD